MLDSPIRQAVVAVPSPSIKLSPPVSGVVSFIFDQRGDVIQLPVEISLLGRANWLMA